MTGNTACCLLAAYICLPVVVLLPVCLFIDRGTSLVDRSGPLLVWIGLSFVAAPYWFVGRQDWEPGGILGWNTSCWWPVFLLFVGGRLFACWRLSRCQFVGLYTREHSWLLGWLEHCLLDRSFPGD